tara:strand:- start:3026 stop:3742 length:717 start_codon:yes stop_codon:yes gene_type:complete
LRNPRYFSIDLLRNRRKLLGYKEQGHISDRVLISKGVAIGGGLVALALLASLGVFVDTNRIKNKQLLLMDDAQKYDSVQSRIIKANRSISQFKKDNKNLAKAITDIRSSSAIIVEISRIIPSSVQLKEVNILDNELRLTGIINSRHSLYEIIAFKLNLQQSSFFKNDEVILLKASEQSIANSFGFDNLNPKVINFEIKAKFSSNLNYLNNKMIIEYLNSLGSKGLAKRLQLVMQEGLL